MSTRPEPPGPNPQSSIPNPQSSEAAGIKRLSRAWTFARKNPSTLIRLISAVLVAVGAVVAVCCFLEIPHAPSRSHQLHWGFSGWSSDDFRYLAYGGLSCFGLGCFGLVLPTLLRR